MSNDNSLENQFDFVVVGGGIAGTMCAQRVGFYSIFLISSLRLLIINC